MWWWTARMSRVAAQNNAQYVLFKRIMGGQRGELETSIASGAWAMLVRTTIQQAARSLALVPHHGFVSCCGFRTPSENYI